MISPLDISLSTVGADDDRLPFRLLEHLALTSGALPAWHYAYRRIDDKLSLDDVPTTFGTRIFDLDQPVYTTRYSLFQCADGTYCCLQKNPGLIYFYVVAPTPEAARAVVTATEAFFPQRPPLPEGQKVNVGFWTLTPKGPRYIERVLAVDPWVSMAGNYVGQTHEQVAKLMGDFKPKRAGQLILWHGVPGTGKTHALRALMWEWRKWCQFAYITDPDQLFGAHADYLIDVLLKANRVGDDGPSGDDPDPTTAVAAVADPSPWTCLILEDAGELMVPDAKERTGQGLSRLLNTVDGLIGQGLKIMVLVTTNEILKKLHPAVARPGRCAARIEFAEFNARDAETWLAAKGLAPYANASALPLCDLYERLEERSQIVAEKKTSDVGFKPAA